MQNEQTPAAGPLNAEPLDALLKRAVQAFKALPPEEQRRQFDEQKRRWVAAEMAMGDEGTRLAPPAPVPSPASSSSVVQGDAGGVERGDEPTEAMIQAGLKVDFDNEDERATIINVWQAMITARPQPTAEPVSRPAGEEKQAWSQERHDYEAMTVIAAHLRDNPAAPYSGRQCEEFVQFARDALFARPAGEGEREAVARATESLDDAARRLFAEQYPDRDYDALKDMVKIGWLRSAHDAILSLLRPAAPDAGGGWMPIETAPKDGTKFDGWQRDERVTDMYWSDVQDAWCIDGTYGPEEPTPLAIFPPVTHWRPLPTPPALQPGGER